MTWPHGDPRDVVRTVLADRRYHVPPHAAAPKSLWELAWDAIRSWWNALVAPLGHELGNGVLTQVIGIAVLAAVVALLVAGVVLFARPLLARRRARAASDRAVAPAAPGTAASLRARAREAADAGRYREAAALLWASALRALDEAGRVRYDAARTPGEWRRMVRDAAFDALARDAVTALFGDRAVDAALVARMAGAYDALVDAR